MTSRAPSKKSSAPAEKAPARFSRRQRYFLITTGTLVVLLVALTAYSFVYAGRFAPNTKVAGIPVGGLTREEAAAKLTERKEEFLASTLTLRHESRQWEVAPLQLGTTLDLNKSLDQKWTAEKNAPWYRQVGTLITALFVAPPSAPETISISEGGWEYLKESVLATIETPYKETTLSFQPTVEIVPGTAGQKLEEEAFAKELYKAFSDSAKTVVLLELEPYQPQVKPEMAVMAQKQATYILAGPWKASPANRKEFVVEPTELASWLKTEVIAVDGQPALGLTIKGDVVEKKLKEWSVEVRQAPQNVRITKEGEGIKVVEEGKDGLDINTDVSLKNIRQQIARMKEGASRQLAVHTDVVRPEVRSDTLAELGIKELIGVASTDFAGSPNNRKFNIGRGQQSLDRLLVKKGEVFSTTGALGPVDESTGYLPELVIKGNRTIPEAGGGLCQVSTTLFRSVLNAGLQIVERTNHAYRVGYYERGVGPGLDATVYIPNPDLKWKNDTENAIFVQSFVKGNSITFELYGTKDGRTSYISSPQIIEEYPVGPPIYVETDTLAKGVTQQIEKAHAGAKVRVEYRVVKDGKDLHKRAFTSVYKMWPDQYLVGTKVDPAAPVESPAPEPSATPTPSPTVQ